MNFKPGKLKTSLPDASKQAWPRGDALPNEPFPHELDMVKVKEAVDAAMAGDDLRRNCGSLHDECITAHQLKQKNEDVRHDHERSDHRQSASRGIS